MMQNDILSGVNLRYIITEKGIFIHISYDKSKLKQKTVPNMSRKRLTSLCVIQLTGQGKKRSRRDEMQARNSRIVIPWYEIDV
jgi:hypothetical protein